LAFAQQRIADGAVAADDDAPPLAVAGIGRGEFLAYCKALAIGIGRFFILTGNELRIADVMVTVSQVSLPLDVTGFGSQQTLQYVPGLLSVAHGILALVLSRENRC